jgi:hypothetical protein
MSRNPSVRRKAYQQMRLIDDEMNQWEKSGMVTFDRNEWVLTDKGRQTPERQQIEHVLKRRKELMPRIGSIGR